MLSIKNLSATIENKTILRDVSLEFETGKTYALLGPNGSGKSTLAHIVMGNPVFAVPEGSRILFEDEDITTLAADKRARLGVFLSFQSPLALPGVSVVDLLRAAVGKKMNALELRQLIDRYAEELRIPRELLRRSLNDGFSGGERKKMEALQWAVLEPKFSIFDEIDTGVDVDAIKTIGQFLAAHRQPEQVLVIISHSARIFGYLRPDETVVLSEGTVGRRGDGALALEISQEGFNQKDDAA